MRLPVAATLVAATLCVPLAARGAPAPAAWAPRPATYGAAITQDVRVTMSDGVRLAVDVIRPAAENGAPANGRFPVVLTQTPYNKAGALSFRSDYLVTRGYVQVVADVRGTGASEGTWHSFDDREQRDGGELVRWAATQPWSDGRVALHGTSYGAINQFLTAEQQPGYVRAMFPIVPMADSYRDISSTGGAVNTSFIPLWLGLVTSLGLLPPTYSGSDPVGAATAVVGHAGGVGSFQLNAVASAMTGGDQAYDGPFYRQRSPIENVDRVRVPTFVVGGWSDLFQRGEPLLYQRLRANGVPSRLLMGPWTHLAAGTGAGLPAPGVPTLDELELRWFDHYARGVADPGLDRDVAPVTYYRLGEAKWRTAGSWPPAGTAYRTLPLGGVATPGTPGALGVSGATGSDTLLPGPLAGACSRSSTQWTSGAGDDAGCDNDNRATDAQGIAYDLPVTTPLALAGPVAARLFVSSNARDALLTARLEDVAPDGTSTQLTAGWQVLSLRALDPRRTVRAGGTIVQPYHPYTRASALPVAANTVYEVWVEVFPTGALVAPGHALRLSLQSADTPHLTPSLPQAAGSAGAVLTLWHDAAHPSALVVPVSR
jgi:putative CocE/NonD family hydrolase